MLSGKSPRKLTILAAGVNAVGHVTGCSGTASAFLRRGHRVVYLLESSFSGTLAPYGFEEHLYNGKSSTTTSTNPGANQANIIKETGLMGPLTPLQKTQNYLKYFESNSYKQQQLYLNRALEEVIPLYKPDLIIFDAKALMPAIYYSGIPWLKNISMAATFYEIDSDLPPGGSGLPTNGDRSQWSTFNTIRHHFNYSATFNDLVEQMGYSRYPDDSKSPDSQILSVYACPTEMDHPAIQRKGWFNLEVFQKKKPDPNFKLNTIVPESFLHGTLDGKFTGKYILISLGSMGSIDLELMQRLIQTLSQTSHKYIVSKGIRSDEYSLPVNMWGSAFLPQMNLVPFVDLVITHGGNNSVTETFSLGKQMLVMPLFTDQYDNAQRLTETFYGARIDPYNYEDEELIHLVDRLLEDKDMKKRLVTAANRIQSEDRHHQLAVKVEKMLENLNIF